MEIDLLTRARFLMKVDVRGPDECWPWTAKKSPQGYGLFTYRKKTVRATHVSLVLAGLPRPGDMLALHSCDNPSCVNPAHLRWGTSDENTADRVSRGRTVAPLGTSHYRAKLTPEKVRHIRSSPLGYKSLARQLGVNRKTVQQVRSGKTWSHVV
jgi:hypothetical protein